MISTIILSIAAYLVLTLLLGMAVGFFIGKARGRDEGLAAPLPDRLRALRQQQRAADIALAHQPPRVRKVAVSKGESR